MNTLQPKAEASSPVALHPEAPVPLFGDTGFIATDPDKILPSEESGRWLIRQDKGRLAASGALLYLAGRWYVLPSLFRAAVIEMGRDAARAKFIEAAQ